jgi:hypothetical protein
MLLIYWLPTTLLSTWCLLPAASVVGMLSTSSDPAPAGSLEGDLG